MADIELAVERREERGTRSARRLRALGRVPGVVYGHGSEPVAISVDARELRHALGSDAGINALLDLSIGSSRHLVLARAVQHHPVRRTLAHVDFQIVGRDEVVTVEVPVELVGEPVSVLRQDGTVEHILTSLQVRAKPADIPGSIVVDVSALEVGSMILVGEIPAIPGVSFDADPETPLVVAHPPRVSTAEGEPDTAESTGEPS